MKALIVYESMYGNTRHIADAIAAGIRARTDGPPVEAAVLPINQADPDRLHGVDLLVVGGPTHAWSMARARTRKTAAEAAGKPQNRLELEPEASGPGVREWLAGLPGGAEDQLAIAVFDTRMHAPLGLSGSAAHAMARRLHRQGARVITKPMGFYVDKHNQLVAGEADRAREWGGALAGLC